MTPHDPSGSFWDHLLAFLCQLLPDDMGPVLPHEVGPVLPDDGGLVLPDDVGPVFRTRWARCYLMASVGLLRCLPIPAGA